ncbi:MAG: GAF domain-containing protein [Verrucomicrobiota bacterium]
MSDSFKKEKVCGEVYQRIIALVAGETDEIALMATIACELHHGFPYFNWTGFYRVVEPEVLKVGPYQGGHGCLVIPFERGICGRCARTGNTLNIPDVHAETDHIACSGATRSEIVVPVFDANGKLRAVFDVDSDSPAVFDEIDEMFLERVCGLFLDKEIRWVNR